MNKFTALAEFLRFKRIKKETDPVRELNRLVEEYEKAESDKKV